MGLNHPDQLRQYRALLRVPDEIWGKADDEHWDEFEIRSYTATPVVVSDEKTPSTSTPKREKPEQLILLDRMKQLFTTPPKSSQDRDLALADIEKFEKFLTEVKTPLSAGKSWK